MQPAVAPRLLHTRPLVAGKGHHVLCDDYLFLYNSHVPVSIEFAGLKLATGGQLTTIVTSVCNPL